MKFIQLLLSCCMMACIIFSCSQPKPSYTPRDVSKAKISLFRTSCYGKCPVYKVTIYGTGTVEFDGYANTKMLGQYTAQIPVDSVRVLIADIEKNGYFALNDSYAEYQITDLPSVNTEVEIDSVHKKINHYKGDLTAPQKLTDLETRIDEIATIRQWLE